MSSVSCDHTDKITQNLGNYELIVQFHIICEDINNDSIEHNWKLRKRKAKRVHCKQCKSTDKIHACLYCPYFGCFFNESKNELAYEHGHIEKHARESHHSISVNMDHGVLFCFICNDYIYDDRCQDIMDNIQEFAKSSLIKRNFVPKTKEVELLKAVGVLKIPDNSYFGLRGVFNYGNTCYANVIVQVLVHTPYLRDYFFADQHKCFLKFCLTCETSALFQEFYSGKTIPLNPVNFYLAAQKYFTPLIGIDPEDTSEFFESIIEGLHESMESSRTSNLCNCTVHKLFHGISQHTFFCPNCASIVEIDADTHNAQTFTQIHLDATLDDPLHPDGISVNLLTCLNMYQSRDVPQLKCPKCSESVNEQVKIKKLPLIIRMNLTYGHEKKKHVLFPEFIDMSSCMLSEVGDYKYCLYAVIVHKTAGHYYCYIKQHTSGPNQRRWFKCNDEYVSKSSFKEVCEDEASILMYYKKNSDFVNELDTRGFTV
ncbi:ubiquitin carboxyl-terminal hydrolase 22 [Nephila pilipes]|uniref:Ubiquitin carboxyl-terminal hydrolase 22 n=1 Tax=Nephila pilipes TaxID=299642 RepID=A0A8X6PT45_NEPPI|nr:ubiquitin carboxyl-terminal hydrolase 22 [Nephila pilipes]